MAFFRSRQYRVRPEGSAKASLLSYAQHNYEYIISVFQDHVNRLGAAAKNNTVKIAKYRKFLYNFNIDYCR